MAIRAIFAVFPKPGWRKTRFGAPICGWTAVWPKGMKLCTDRGIAAACHSKSSVPVRDRLSMA